MNTGDKRVNSMSNLLSGIAWGIGDEITYSLEGSAFNAGSIIKWLRDEVELIKPHVNVTNMPSRWRIPTVFTSFLHLPVWALLIGICTQGELW